MRLYGKCKTNMTVESEDFRAVLRHFPAGVTIVTMDTGEEKHGLTVSAFASISPTPPLIMVAIDHKHRSEQLIRDAESFGVNILAADQQELSNRFAFFDGDRFAEGDWTTAETGAPILADALAWLDCKVVQAYWAGTHTIFVGEVQASSVPRPGEPPLVYWNRAYRDLSLESEAEEA